MSSTRWQRRRRRIARRAADLDAQALDRARRPVLLTRATDHAGYWKSSSNIVHRVHSVQIIWRNLDVDWHHPRIIVVTSCEKNRSDLRTWDRSAGLQIEPPPFLSAARNRRNGCSHCFP